MDMYIHIHTYVYEYAKLTWINTLYLVYIELYKDWTVDTDDT